jgi:hypothetical protein
MLRHIDNQQDHTTRLDVISDNINIQPPQLVIRPSTKPLTNEEISRRNRDVEEYNSQIMYSKRYSDDEYEYR